MTPETRQLIQLLRLACARNFVTPISGNDIAAALNAFEPALQQTLLYKPCLQTVIKDLHEAAVTVAAFIYTWDVTPVKNLSFPKNLFEKLTITYSDICTIINSYRQTDNNAVAEKLLGLNVFGKALAVLQQQLSAKYAGSATYDLLSVHIQAATSYKPVSFHNWLWWSHFYNQASSSLQSNETSLNELLTKCGFNCPAFISLLTGELINDISSKDSFNERLAFITKQLLKYKLIPMLGPHSYIPGLPSIKKTMLSLFKKQLLILQAGDSISCASTVPLNTFKIPVNVPVSQLALFIRLFIDSGIIKSDNHTELLKHLAAGITTPKTTSVSADSLRVNFYAPPPVAKNIVKDYLVKMMTQLRTIES